MTVPLLKDLHKANTVLEASGIHGQQGGASVDHEQDEQDGSVAHWKKVFRKCLVEFIGTLTFVTIGIMSVTSKSGVLGIAISHGITIFVLITSVGHISGGHINPAVTLGIMWAGGIDILTGLLYIPAQFLGGFLGALLVRIFLQTVVHGDVYENKVEGGIIMPSTDYDLEALICEIILTFFLVLTALMTAVGTNGNKMAPLAIGLSITMGILAGGNISGASMNPTRSFGPAVAYSAFGVDHDQWKKMWIYFCGPIIGSGIAALLYRTFLANKQTRWILK